MPALAPSDRRKADVAARAQCLSNLAANDCGHSLRSTSGRKHFLENIWREHEESIGPGNCSYFGGVLFSFAGCCCRALRWLRGRTYKHWPRGRVRSTRLIPISATHSVCSGVTPIPIPPIQPTPRWTTYDAAFFNVELPKNIEPTHQERAYTSPVWYTP